MSFQSFNGAPQILQGHYAPTQSEAVDMDEFNFGTITFFWDRLNNNMLWLQSVDSNNFQSWANYPIDIDSLNIIGILPSLNNKLYWFLANYNPTSSELISPDLFDGTHGMIWWNNLSNNLWKLTGFSANEDGTYTQEWTQII